MSWKAELPAILQGLYLARSKGSPTLCVTLILCCLFCVNLVKNATSEFNKYATIIQVMKDMLLANSHLLREGNCYANFMTKFGTTNDDFLTILLKLLAF